MIRVHAVAGKNINIATDEINRRATKYEEETNMIELSDVRNELDTTAKKLVDFRGSL